MSQNSKPVGMITTGNHLLAGIIAGVGFAVALLVLNLGFVPAIIATPILYLGVLLVSQKKVLNLADVANTGDLELRRMVEDFLRQTEPVAENLRQMASQLPASRLRNHADAVVKLLEKILLDVRRDPRDVRSARSFLNQTIGSTEAIFRHCLELQKHRGSSSVETALNKAEESLKALEHAFGLELDRLQEDNLLDLDVEMKVLTATLSQNGYTDMAEKAKTPKESV